jgi:carbamoyltransferase
VERIPCTPDAMKGSLLGDAFSNEAVEAMLRDQGCVYERLDRGELIDRTVSALVAGQVVGWFQGRMEYGPRALGNRSILGDPRTPGMQQQLNLKIKFRESFRPFAPVVLADRVGDYFEMRGESPYMLLVDKVREEWLQEVDAAGLPEEGESRMRALLEARRSTIPAVTHVDNSARIQTVDASRNPLFHKLLMAWEARTGCPVLVNTSFNIRGEPIVHSPADAWRCFAGTHMDVLVMETCLVEKKKNPHLAADMEAYRGEYPLD